MMRLYWPKEKDPSILDGTWKIPAVRRNLTGRPPWAPGRFAGSLTVSSSQPRCVVFTLPGRTTRFRDARPPRLSPRRGTPAGTGSS